jgi:CPA1 family monovalent cation:H+ antiporter
MLDAQQNALLDARAGGTYGSHTLERAQHVIDNQAARFSAGQG